MRQQIGMEARVAAVMILNTTEIEFGPMNLTPKSPRSIVWIAPNRSRLVAVHLKQECFNSMLMVRLRKGIPKPLNRVREPFPPPNIKDVDGLRLEGGQPFGMMSCKGKQMGAAPLFLSLNVGSSDDFATFTTYD